MFFEMSVDKKNDRVFFDIILKTNEDYISVTLGCNMFIDSYRFLSSSLDSLGKTLTDNSHKTFRSLKKEIVANDEILNIIEIVEDETIKDLQKDYPDKNEKLEEALLKYMRENDLNF